MTVAGVLSTDVGGFQGGGAGAFMAAPFVKEFMGRDAVPSQFYLDVSGDPDDLATQLQGALLTNGVEADSFLALVTEQARTQQGFFRLMTGLPGARPHHRHRRSRRRDGSRGARAPSPDRHVASDGVPTPGGAHRVPARGHVHRRARRGRRRQPGVDHRLHVVDQVRLVRQPAPRLLSAVDESPHRRRRSR